jgi:hypothetical protein
MAVKAASYTMCVHKRLLLVVRVMLLLASAATICANSSAGPVKHNSMIGSSKLLRIYSGSHPFDGLRIFSDGVEYEKADWVISLSLTPLTSVALAVMTASPALGLVFEVVRYLGHPERVEERCDLTEAVRKANRKYLEHNATTAIELVSNGFQGHSVTGLETIVNCVFDEGRAGARNAYMRRFEPLRDVELLDGVTIVQVDRDLKIGFNAMTAYLSDVSQLGIGKSPPEGFHWRDSLAVITGADQLAKYNDLVHKAFELDKTSPEIGWTKLDHEFAGVRAIDFTKVEKHCTSRVWQRSKCLGAPSSGGEYQVELSELIGSIGRGILLDLTVSAVLTSGVILRFDLLVGPSIEIFKILLIVLNSAISGGIALSIVGIVLREMLRRLLVGQRAMIYLCCSNDIMYTSDSIRNGNCKGSTPQRTESIGVSMDGKHLGQVKDGAWVSQASWFRARDVNARARNNRSILLESVKEAVRTE